MVGQGGGGAAQVVQVSSELAPAVRVVHHQVDGHLALQTADVAVAEVVAQLVDLDPGYTVSSSERIHNIINYRNTSRAVRVIILPFLIPADEIAGLGSPESSEE